MAAIQGTAAELSPAEVFKLAAPSIVVIHAMDASGRSVALGSGVAISPETVVSNCHVIVRAASIAVEYQSRRYPAALQYTDAERDLCSLLVPRLPAKVVLRGISASLPIGSRTYAVGAPRGLDLSLSDGLLSSRRAVAGGWLLQTTTAISPGSSGGGLFDAQGYLIGITTMTLTESQQLNFAVPVEWIAELPQRSARTVMARAPRPSGPGSQANPPIDPPHPADRWLAVYADDRVVVRFDTQSLQRTAAETHVWSETKYLTNAVTWEGKDVAKVLERKIFYCSKRASASERTIAYDERGLVVRELDIGVKETLSSIVPNSPEEASWQAACLSTQ